MTMKFNFALVSVSLVALTNGARLRSSTHTNHLHNGSSTYRRSGSLKKGMAVSPTSNMQCEDVKMFDKSNYGWWYSWRQAPTQSWEKSDECKELLPQSRFVPMLKNVMFLEAEQLDQTFMDAPYLMGFNEPYGDHSKKKTGAAAMTPNDCLDGMNKVIEKAESASHQIEIVAPTVNPKKSAMAWYKKYYALAKQSGQWDKFSYINVHSYRCDSTWLMKKLKKIYDTFGQKPIWLTEFNCNGNGVYSGGMATPAQHLLYMQQLLPKLEQASFVARYSWYTMRNQATPTCNLAKGTSQKEGAGWDGELTELGKWYDEYVPEVTTEPEEQYDHTEHDDDDRGDGEGDDDDNGMTDWYGTPSSKPMIKNPDNSTPAAPSKVSDANHSATLP